MATEINKKTFGPNNKEYEAKIITKIRDGMDTKQV